MISFLLDYQGSVFHLAQRQVPSKDRLTIATITLNERQKNISCVELVAVLKINASYLCELSSLDPYNYIPFSSINTALVCEDCNDLHYGDCPVHGPLQIIEDKPREENPDVSAAVASLPASLKIGDSSIHGAGLGVFSTSEIPKGVQFGPYKGLKIGWENITEDRNTSYCWEVCFYEHLKNFINLTFSSGESLQLYASFPRYFLYFLTQMVDRVLGRLGVRVCDLQVQKYSGDGLVRFCGEIHKCP